MLLCNRMFAKVCIMKRSKSESDKLVVHFMLTMWVCKEKLPRGDVLTVLSFTVLNYRTLSLDCALLSVHIWNNIG